MATKTLTVVVCDLCGGHDGEVTDTRYTLDDAKLRVDAHAKCFDVATVKELRSKGRPARGRIPGQSTARKAPNSAGNGVAKRAAKKTPAKKSVAKKAATKRAATPEPQAAVEAANA